MERTDAVLAVLTEIRDDGQRNGARIDETNARLNETNARLEHIGETLGRRIVESELRTATAISALGAGTRQHHQRRS